MRRFLHGEGFPAAKTGRRGTDQKIYVYNPGFRCYNNTKSVIGTGVFKPLRLSGARNGYRHRLHNILHLSFMYGSTEDKTSPYRKQTDSCLKAA
ncbi:hypothetical protein SAMN02745168_0285 [Papillibacter cinnamivorans DSM 12816]|uniref:Uncharacterized protein n=1 Tax=Papillibacter cinnamivorans DSM 12816 TaxID=1122930 RepID=A0A1W2D0G9_9FIRM|nr:hypothetical protein SAMN02745168_0285 [Papillibacter cinnamivorans DSM 12816]